MSTPHPSLTKGSLGPSQLFGPLSPWVPSSFMGLVVSGSCPAALVFPFFKAQPGVADESGASPGERTAAVLGWAVLGWERAGRLHCSDGTFFPPPGLSSSSPGCPREGLLRGDQRWCVDKQYFHQSCFYFNGYQKKVHKQLMH